MLPDLVKKFTIDGLRGIYGQLRGKFARETSTAAGTGAAVVKLQFDFNIRRSAIFLLREFEEKGVFGRATRQEPLFFELCILFMSEIFFQRSFYYENLRKREFLDVQHVKNLCSLNYVSCLCQKYQRSFYYENLRKREFLDNTHATRQEPLFFELCILLCQKYLRSFYYEKLRKMEFLDVQHVKNLCSLNDVLAARKRTLDYRSFTTHPRTNEHGGGCTGGARVWVW
ncbi:hypothetical protein J6590_029663 [Homalodisca vitripennis]|nr:hypothetical protein J6590_029663 [Homalodisca vitripennis]